MLRIIETLGCGNLGMPSPGRNEYSISVANHKASGAAACIPHRGKSFILYYYSVLHGILAPPSLRGGGATKALDFQDFCTGLNIIHQKGHLTEEGLAD